MPSTVIRHIDYSEQTQDMQIEFVSGLIYTYHHVPVHVYDAFKRSKVKGIYFNQHIKDQYPFDKTGRDSGLFD